MTSPNTKVESITMQRRTKPHEPSNLMTIREYFAAMAMQGLLANGIYPKGHAHSNLDEVIAREAVSYADALIEQLNK